MSDFKSFSQDTPPEKGGSTTQNNTVDLINALVKAFSGKNEGEIWKNVLAQAEQGKRDGTLTNEDLDNFYTALSPLLDGFKRQKLKSVINKLKAI